MLRCLLRGALECFQALRMQGTPQEALATRDGADRVYGFDVYNDLGKPAEGPTKIRPTLGTATLPFPRRISL